MGLLEDLRRQASAINDQQQDSAAIYAARVQLVDNCLAQIYHYLADLSSHLNVVKPKTNKKLEFTPNMVFDDLNVSNFFIDYRKTRKLERDVFNDIVFAFNYQGPENFTVKKELPLEIERLSDQLKQLGIKYEREDFKNQRRLLSHSNFLLFSDIRAGLKIIADYDYGQILFKLKNIERLGVVDYLFMAEHINDSKLEELAHLLLGEPNKFRTNTAPMRLNLPKS